MRCTVEFACRTNLTRKLIEVATRTEAAAKTGAKEGREENNSWLAWRARCSNACVKQFASTETATVYRRCVSKVDLDESEITYV